jgi:hypothetical protein
LTEICRALADDVAIGWTAETNNVTDSGATYHFHVEVSREARTDSAAGIGAVCLADLSVAAGVEAIRPLVGTMERSESLSDQIYLRSQQRDRDGRRVRDRVAGGVSALGVQWTPRAEEQSGNSSCSGLRGVKEDWTTHNRDYTIPWYIMSTASVFP